MVKELRKPSHPKRKRFHPNIEDRTTIISYYETYKNILKVSKESQWSYVVCYRIIRRYEEEQTLSRKKGQGRKRKTTAEDDRYIAAQVKKNRHTTLKAIVNDLSFVKVSRMTVSRRIAENSDMSSQWKRKRPFINNNNRIKRLRWCKERINWTKEQWNQILWSDESPFVLRYNRRTRVWRTSSEVNKPWTMTGTVKHDQKIMVWGCFSSIGVGNFYLVEGIMTKEQYLHILENEMLPSARRLFGDSEWKFQEDNDPKLTAKVCKQFHIDRKTNRIEWPAQSPDLNPIENLWSILDERCKNRQPNSKQELFNILKSEWNKLDISLLTSLVDSMPNRIQQVIKNKGFPINY